MEHDIVKSEQQDKANANTGFTAETSSFQLKTAAPQPFDVSRTKKEQEGSGSESENKSPIQNTIDSPEISTPQNQSNSVDKTQAGKKDEKGEAALANFSITSFDIPPILPEPTLPFNAAADSSPQRPNDENSNPTGLPNETLAKMNGAFNADFSNVKIHKNSSQASDMGAMAFAQGNEVHFAPGQYSPDTTSGQELIGHELTHVKQQASGQVKANKQAKGLPINDDPSLEREADEMGVKAAKRQPVQVLQNEESSDFGKAFTKKESLQLKIDEHAGLSMGPYQLKEDLSPNKTLAKQLPLQKKESSGKKSAPVPSSKEETQDKDEKVNRVVFLHEEIMRLNFDNSRIISSWSIPFAEHLPVYKEQDLTLTEYNKLLNDEMTLYGFIAPAPHSISSTTINDYLLASEILYDTLLIFTKTTKKRAAADKVTQQAKADVNSVNFMLLEGFPANVDNNKLLRILQSSYPYSGQRDALFLAETGKNFREVILSRTKILESLNTDSFIHIMARAYLDAGSLRPVDKFYIAVTGAGTDEGNVFFAMKQAHSYGIERMEAEYELYFKEDDYDDKDTWLPLSGYKRRKWAIAGRLGGDIRESDPDSVKAKCYLSFGKVRKIDKIKLAMLNGINNTAILDALRETMEGGEHEDVKADFTYSWGGNIESIMHINNTRSIAKGNSKSGLITEDEKQDINEQNAKDDEQLNAITSGKEKKEDHWKKLFESGSKKKAFQLFLKADENTKWIIVSSMDPYEINVGQKFMKISSSEVEKYLQILELESNKAFQKLKEYNCFTPKEVQSFIKFSATKNDYEIIKSGSSSKFNKYVADSNLGKVLAPVYRDPKYRLIDPILAKDLNWATNIIATHLTEEEKTQFVNDKKFNSYFNYNSPRDNKLNKIRKGMTPDQVIEAGTDRGFKEQIEGLLNNDFKTRIFAERDLLRKSNSGLSSDITNEFSTSGLSAENEQRELEVSLEMAEFDDGKIDAQEGSKIEDKIKDAQSTRQNFIQTRNTIETTAKMMAGIVLSIVGSAFIPGSAGIVARILWSAAISSGSQTIAPLILEGSRYSYKRAMNDFFRGALDGIMAKLGPLALTKMKGLKEVKGYLAKTILEEVASDIHNVPIDLATDSGKQAFHNFISNLAIGSAMNGATDLSQHLKKGSRKTMHESGKEDLSDELSQDNIKDSTDPSAPKADKDLDSRVKDKTDDLETKGHSGQKLTKDNLTDSEVIRFIMACGGWKKALNGAADYPFPKDITDAMEALRIEVVAKIKSGSLLKGSSGGASSDKDVNITGDKAGQDLVDEHDRLTREFGDYEKFFDLALMPDKSRLGKAYEVTGDNAEKIRQQVNMSSEKYILARRLRNAEGNPKELNRIEEELKGRTDSPEIRKLAGKDPEKSQKTVRKNHIKIDKLLKRLKNKRLSSRKRDAIMKKISLLSQDINFLTTDAYLGSSTLKFLSPDEAVDNMDDLYIIIQDQLSFIQGKIKYYNGSIGEAALDYKIFHYEARILRAMEIAGIELSDKLKHHQRVAEGIAVKMKDPDTGEQMDHSLLGRDFNATGYRLRRTDEMRANNVNDFLDLIRDEVLHLKKKNLSPEQIEKIAVILNAKNVGNKSHSDSGDKEENEAVAQPKMDANSNVNTSESGSQIIPGHYNNRQNSAKTNDKKKNLPFQLKTTNKQGSTKGNTIENSPFELDSIDNESQNKDELVPFNI